MIEDIRKRLKRYQFVENPNVLDREQAAVLLPIVNPANPSLVLTQRSGQLDSHAGEVAWPGGKRDDEDETLRHTALRETEEEIGLKRDRVEVVAELRPFISKHGLAVTPFVGLIEAEIEFQVNAEEIDSIFFVPLDYLLDDPRTDTNIIERHGERHVIPEYHYDGFRIWGLTAMILLEFLTHGMGMDLLDR